MSQPETLPVRIRSSDDQYASGTVELKVWEKKERTLRGLKALGISWGLGLAAVLIPILHFVLVPLLFLAGPIAFFWMAGQERLILGGTGECPRCRKSVAIVRSPVKWPIFDLCNHCQSELIIERA